MLARLLEAADPAAVAAEHVASLNEEVGGRARRGARQGGLCEAAEGKGADVPAVGFMFCSGSKVSGTLA